MSGRVDALRSGTRRRPPPGARAITTRPPREFSTRTRPRFSDSEFVYIQRAHAIGPERQFSIQCTTHHPCARTYPVRLSHVVHNAAHHTHARASDGRTGQLSALAMRPQCVKSTSHYAVSSPRTALEGRSGRKKWEEGGSDCAARIGVRTTCVRAACWR